MLQDFTDRHSDLPDCIDGLQTPCLLLDEGRLDANVARMRAHLDACNVAFRPHLKTAKSLDVTQRVLPHPSGPATVSTLKEAEIFAKAGVKDMIYAVGIAPAKLPRVLALRRAGIDLAILADCRVQAEAIAAASADGPPLPTLIEIDCDGHRSGLVPEDAAEIVAVGRILDAAGALRGVLTHAGGSYGDRTPDACAASAARERAGAVAAAEHLRGAGLPCPVVSVGSTPTAASGADFAGITEVRAGVFMFFDLVQAGIGVCTTDDIALSVLTSVIGHRRDKGWIIVDAGWMAMSRDLGTADQPVNQFYGLVCGPDGVPIPDLVMVAANQEHGILACRPGRPTALPDLPVGARLRILPNHACATAAQHDGYVVVRAGSDRIHGYWPRFGGW
ncbi:alanine racemase [Aquabacter spiritensis]|uniref:D-serine deaminase-like pyridoxal phosphate-dependent protein n=1 Tax=Aquabacter spiritensis TaxID=933073 RepID=A0A4R3M295_9HYPH|nr:alanine racemase [Aquabacter spiritensis]TCT06783.1 D-serine deaminase-like pyridoxal phosphate-dependent protein [Aquabacter spiritensis]